MRVYCWNKTHEVVPVPRESVYSMLENRLIFWIDDAKRFLAQSEHDPEEAEFLRYVLSSCILEFSAFRKIRCHEDGVNYLKREAKNLHKKLDQL